MVNFSGVSDACKCIHIFHPEMIDTQKQDISGFRTSHGREVEDIRLHLTQWLEAHPNGEIYIGTDSKVLGNKVKYSTVICMWDVGRGVWEMYKNFTVPRLKDRYTRLWQEITLSLELAEQLRDLAPNITLHMDFNSNPKFASYNLYDAGMGLITSMGYKGAGKPDAWAATYGANRHCQ